MPQLEPNQAPLTFAGACDCHLHVYEAGYALAPTATFTPPPAPVSAYQAVQKTLGLSRAVVVQPTGYGFDNSCTLAALACLGSGARGIAVVPPDVSTPELRRLHDGGMRGVRFMMLPGGVLPWSALEPLAERIAPLGWHINLQMNGCEFGAYASRLRALQVPVVIDHIGKFLDPAGPVASNAPAFHVLCSLLETGRFWIKLSAPYESSHAGPPLYADVGALAQVLAREFPDRCLWASNWPHPNRVPAPREGDLLNLLFAWAPDAATARRILVDNPALLYGFAPL